MFSIASIVAGTAAGEIGQSVRQLRWRMLFYILAGVLVLTAYVSVVSALVIYLAQTHGIVSALLLVSFASLFLAVVAIGVMKARTEYIRRKRRQRSEINTLAVAAGLSVLPGLVKHRGLFVAISVAGLAALAGAGMRNSK